MTTGDVLTPFEQAAAVYRREPCARTFTEDVEAHFMGGWVFSTPRFFVMARPVKFAWGDDVVLNPFVLSSDPDMWHVWIAAGDWREALKHAPFPLPWISIERRTQLKRYAWHRFLRRSAI